MTTLFSKIKEVTELSAISGHEGPVRNYLREKITPHVDEIITDGLGGIFGVRHSQAEKCSSCFSRGSHGRGWLYGQRD